MTEKMERAEAPQKVRTEWAMGTVGDPRHIPRACQDLTDEGWAIHTILLMPSAIAGMTFGIVVHRPMQTDEAAAHAESLIQPMVADIKGPVPNTGD